MNIHYNETALLGALKNVYEFIRTPITVYDENFRCVTHYSVDSLGQYCRLIRESEENQQRCKKSDDEGCARCRASKQRESYRCYAGLNETVMPIRYNDMLLGYIMFGKYRLWGEVIDIGKYAESLGVDKDKLGRACEELSVLTPEQVEERIACQMGDDELHARANHTMVNISLDYLRSDVEALDKILRREASRR